MEKIDIEKWSLELREFERLLIELWGSVGFLERANLHAQDGNVKDYNDCITLGKFTVRHCMERLLKRGLQMGEDIDSICTVDEDSEA